MIYYINKKNQLYIGDLQNGDRVANNEELLNHFKQLKLQELKANCQNYILSIYPIYKQLNIINPLSDYNNEDKVSMNTFIDNQRQICASKEEEINNSNLENINTISTNFLEIL